MLTDKEITEIYDPGSKGFVVIVANPSDPDTDPSFALIRDNLVRFAGTAMNPTRSVLNDFDAATVAQGIDENNKPDNPAISYVFRHKRTKRTFVGQVYEKLGWKPQLSIISDLSEIATRKSEE